MINLWRLHCFWAYVTGIHRREACLHHRCMSHHNRNHNHKYNMYRHSTRRDQEVEINRHYTVYNYYKAYVLLSIHLVKLLHILARTVSRCRKDYILPLWFFFLLSSFFDV